MWIYFLRIAYVWAQGLVAVCCSIHQFMQSLCFLLVIDLHAGTAIDLHVMDVAFLLMPTQHHLCICFAGVLHDLFNLWCISDRGLIWVLFSFFRFGCFFCVCGGVGVSSWKNGFLSFFRNLAMRHVNLLSEFRVVVI